MQSLTLILVGQTFLIGLLGGAHCMAMCGPLCGAISAAGDAAPPSTTGGGQKTVVIQTNDAAAAKAVPAGAWASFSTINAPTRARGILRRSLLLQLGRLLSYSALGAVVALAMQSLAWLTNQTTLLRPAWTLLQACVLAWGLWLLFTARQPAWLERAGQKMWRRVQPALQSSKTPVLTGGLLALLPCGLIYAALPVAAMGGTAWTGALAMAAFTVGSGIWLVLTPWLWRVLKHRVNGARQDVGTRLAGLLLCMVAAWSLWASVAHKTQLWCL